MNHSTLDESRVRGLALFGLAKRVRPCRPGLVSVADELFLVDDDIRRGERALVVLQATFESLDAVSVAFEDAKIYAREVERRKKRLLRLARERDAKLLIYGNEILESCAVHPELAAYSDFFSTRR